MTFPVTERTQPVLEISACLLHNKLRRLHWQSGKEVRIVYCPHQLFELAVGQHGFDPADIRTGRIQSADLTADFLFVIRKTVLSVSRKVIPDPEQCGIPKELAFAGHLIQISIQARIPVLSDIQFDDSICHLDVISCYP